MLNDIWEFWLKGADDGAGADEAGNTWPVTVSWLLWFEAKERARW